MGLEAIRKFRYAQHTDNTYAKLITDPTGAGSEAFIYPQAEAIEGHWGIEQHPRDFQVGDTQKFPGATGAKTAGIKFALEARSFGNSGAGAAVKAGGSPVGAGVVNSEAGLLLKSIFGNETLDTGSAISSMTTGTITMASTANFSVGNFVGIVGTDGLFYVRQIRSKSATVLTLDRAFPAAAGTASTVAFASATYWRADTGHQHLWFDYETQDFRRKIFGCLGDLKFKNLAAKAKAMMEFDFKGIDWQDPGLGQPAPTYPANLPAQGAIIRNTRVYIGATPLLVADFDFEFGNELVPLVSTQALNGLQGWRAKDAKRMMKFKLEYADGGMGATVIANWKAKTLMDMLIEMTQGGAGNSFAIAAPQVELVDVKRVGLNGLDYLECTASIARNDTVGTPIVPDVAIGLL